MEWSDLVAVAAKWLNCPFLERYKAAGEKYLAEIESAKEKQKK